MCGRFALTTNAAELARLFGATRVAEAAPRYNIPPAQPVLAVRQPAGGQGRELVTLRWGLIPAWATDPAVGNRLANARAESAADKPSFRDAFRRRRCLVPADGFFEWRRRGGSREPFFVRRRDGRPLAMAGLWECWHAPDGAPVETCTVLTTDANEVVRPLHDRMPALLAPGDVAAWLDPALQDPATVHRLLRPYPAGELVAVPVSRRVNDPRHDDPQVLEPAGAEVQRLLF